MSERATDPATPFVLRWSRAFGFALPCLYLAASAVRAGEARFETWTAILVGIGGALYSSRCERRSSRIVAFAAGITIAMLPVSSRPGWAAVIREGSILAGAIVASRSIARADGDLGLARAATAAEDARLISVRALERLTMLGLVLSFGSAFAVDVLAWLRFTSFREIASVYAASAGALGLFVLGAGALGIAGARRFEIAVVPRALAAAGIAAAALAFGLTLDVATNVRADAGVTTAVALATPAILFVGRAEDALLLARRARRALTLLVYGVPVALLGAVAVEGRLLGAGATAAAFVAIAIVVGGAATELERVFLPAKGVLLDALEAARDAARDREARAAMSTALLALQAAVPAHRVARAKPHPELWLLDAAKGPRLAVVDAAGYLQERDGELPQALVDLAASEPNGTLRTDVLRPLEVRRPDLRSLLRFMEDRDLLFATVITESAEPDGILLFPAGARKEPMTLEETTAAKKLADAFVAVCQARCARDRHLARERELKEAIDTIDDEVVRLRHDSTLDVGRNVLASHRLARPATVGIYSAASRMAYAALERRIENDAPIVLVARAGVDPVPYLARAHLGGTRRDAPLVIVDGTSSREHDVARWRDPGSSPLALADRGLLVLVDGAALPRDVQILVARALAERRTPWASAMPLDIAIAFTGVAAPSRLVDDGRLAPELHSRFEEIEPIEMPGLRDRAEDLHSIVADRLAREGLRVHGRPVGIDAAAFSRLVEYSFDGEDAELASIVTRLVARVSGDVVRAADVDALGLVIVEEAPAIAVRRVQD